MLIVTIIDLPEDADGTAGDAPDRVAEAVLARVEDECGYAADGGPHVPAEVTVYAVEHSAADQARDGANRLCAALASARSIGHGPLLAGRS